MKYFLLSLSLLSLVSCFESNSSVESIAEAQSLAEKMGDGKFVLRNFYYPFTDKGLTEYNPDELLSDVPGYGSVIGLFTFPLAKRFARNTQLKIPTMLSFPDFDPATFKEVKIKRVFFYIKDCDENYNCKRGNSKATFDIIKNLFVNLTPYRADLHESEIAKAESQDYSFKTIEGFRGIRASWKSKAEFRNRLKKALDHRPDNRKSFEDYTLAVYDEKNNYTTSRFRLTDKNKKTLPIYIFHHDEKYVELREFFMRPIFKGLVDNVFLTGSSVVVDIQPGKENNERFRRLLNSKEAYQAELFHFNTQNRNLSVNQCTVSTCIELKVRSGNLMELFRYSSEMKVDTYLTVGELSQEHFEYKGFIELNIKMDI